MELQVAAEDILKNLCEVHNTEYVIAVPHNIIGPRQKYDDPYRNVVSIMINLMLQNRQPFIYGDENKKDVFLILMMTFLSKRNGKNQMLIVNEDSR